MHLQFSGASETVKDSYLFARKMRKRWTYAQKWSISVLVDSNVLQIRLGIILAVSANMDENQDLLGNETGMSFSDLGSACDDGRASTSDCGTPCYSAILVLESGAIFDILRMSSNDFLVILDSFVVVCYLVRPFCSDEAYPWISLMCVTRQPVWSQSFTDF